MRNDDIVHTAGFEELPPNRAGMYDLVTSNIPFGNFRVFDKHYSNHSDPARRNSVSTIHNFFLTKGIDSLQEGGLLAYVVPRGVADSESNDPYRRWLVEQANLVSAIRLPDNLFADHAETSAGTDFILFQKVSEKQSLSSIEEKFLQRTTLENGISFNALFEAPEYKVCSTEQPGTNQYGHAAMVYTWSESWDEFRNQLYKKLTSGISDNFDRKLFYSGKTATMEAGKETPAAQKRASQSLGQSSLFNPGGLLSGTAPSAEVSLKRRTFSGKMLSYYQDGTMLTDAGQVGTLDIPWDGDPVFVPLDLSSLEALKAKDYIALRDAYKELSTHEQETGMEHADLRENLNQLYKKFNGYYGDLNAKSNRNLILSDTLGREVLSLERTVKGEKRLADLFYRPVSFSPMIEHTDSAYEALAVSLNLYGRVEPQLICDLTDRSWDELREELKDRVFFDPMENNYQIGDRFISGDVISKSEKLAGYAEKYPESEEIRHSLQALREAIPEPIPYHELYLNLGERWIPEDVYSRFATELFQTDVWIFYNPVIDEFSIKAKGDNALITERFAVEGVDEKLNGVTMLRYAFYDTIPRITKPEKDEKGEIIRVPDNEAIQRAITVTQDIRREFEYWLERQENPFREELTDRYNRLFNCYAMPKYDGSHLTLADLDLKALGYEKVHDSQRDAVWKFLMNQGGIADHKVGSGKTLLGCILAHEMKRLGISDKTIYTCMKTNVDKVATEYMTAYPNDKVLYPSEKDFEPENRVRLFHDMKNNDWDVIILTHEQFGKIPKPLDVQKSVLDVELKSVKESLKVYEDEGNKVSNRMKSGLETRKRNLEAKLKTLNHKLERKRDDVPDMREMGIGHIISDEHHVYKNQPFHTRNDRVAGIGNPTGSQRAQDMLYGMRTLQDDKDKDLQVTGMSGTMIVNSLSEMYLILKSFRPRELERQNIRCFDAWASTYTRKSTEFEIGVTGEVILKERYRFFVKVPELSAFYRAIADCRTGKDLGLDEPLIVPHLHSLPQTPEQEEFSKRLVMFAKDGNGDYIGRPGMSEAEKKAKMLIATNISRKVAVDMRLIDPHYFHDHPDNKVRAVAQQVAGYYRKYDEYKATQLVFCDFGVFKPEKWNVYGEIKRLLTEEHGIPAEEIRFIQEAKTADAKSNLTDAVNAGIVRVVIGSSDTLGTGNNMQEKLCALHNVDINWTPKSEEQRRGRGERPGNLIIKEASDNKMPVHYYATKNSLDAYMYHLVHVKKNFIDQIKDGTITKRIIDEGGCDESQGMNMLEFVSLLTGNNDLLEKAKLEKEIAALEGERKSLYVSKLMAEKRLEAERGNLGRYRETVSEMTVDLTKFDAIAPKRGDGSRPPVLTVDGVKSTDEKMMAEKLAVISRTASTGGEFKKIGKLGPFPIVVKTSVDVDKDGNHRSVNRFFVEGLGSRKIKYQYNNGYLATDPALACANFPKAMDRIPATSLLYREKIETTEKDIAILERMAAEVWPRESELETKRAELKTLDKRIEESVGKEQTYEGLKPIRFGHSKEQENIIDIEAEEITGPYDVFDIPEPGINKGIKM